MTSIVNTIFRRRRTVAPSKSASTVPDNGHIRPLLTSLPRPPILHSTVRGPSDTLLPPVTAFYGSQVGGKAVINYSYTDLPWKLLAYDVAHCIRLLWALPSIVWPLTPAQTTSSGAMAELACTWANLWCVGVHAVLMVLQLAFLLVMVPVATVALPAWAALCLVGVCVATNHVLCDVLLNGGGSMAALLRLGDQPIVYTSNPSCAAARPEHAHEQWVFLNGVAVGRHWLQSNLDRLALTFGRPVLGIHNCTAGIVFDVLECLVQRSWTYATQDVRVCYSMVKETLYRPEIRKVVFVVHSQGGIEGGLVLDWLLQELPQDLLAKLEVYTFGNAANHWNNPHRTLAAQRSAAGGGSGHGRDRDRGGDGYDADNVGKAIGHIEHYAHTSDFVALWGVLHFATAVPQTRTVPRFLGRVFAHSTPCGGHQFVQHYLDGMFPLAVDPVSGAYTGCAETGNAFMESDVALGRDVDGLAIEAAAFHDERADSEARDGTAARVEVHTTSPILVRQASQLQAVKVKDISRLWQYRNGQSPA